MAGRLSTKDTAGSPNTVASSTQSSHSPHTRYSIPQRASAVAQAIRSPAISAQPGRGGGFQNRAEDLLGRLGMFRSRGQRQPVGNGELKHLPHIPGNGIVPSGQPQLDIEKNFIKLSDEIKSKVLEFIKREIYDETITMKCLRCNHEETLDWEMIEEMFDEKFERYPLLHCPKCGKSKFVPIDIYKEQKL